MICMTPFPGVHMNYPTSPTPVKNFTSNEWEAGPSYAVSQLVVLNHGVKLLLVGTRFCWMQKSAVTGTLNHTTLQYRVAVL
jgi:hypothetical protein